VVYLAEEYYKTRGEAREFCQGQGGDLLTITSQEQQAALYDRIKSYRLWVGLAKQPDAWRWASSNQPAAYSPWGENQPELFVDDVRAMDAGLCAEFDSTSNTGAFWNSYFCDERQPFACQLGKCFGSAAVITVLQQGCCASGSTGLPSPRQVHHLLLVTASEMMECMHE
jgi:hypothetical protein